MNRLLKVLIVSALAVGIAVAQDAPPVYTSFLTGVTLTSVQAQSVATLAQTRDSAIASAQAQSDGALAELNILLDAADPDLARIGTLSRRVRTLAAQQKQAYTQFRRDVWQLLTPAQRDILLARLGL